MKTPTTLTRTEQLETELAEMTKQRDGMQAALTKALDEIVKLKTDNG